MKMIERCGGFVERDDDDYDYDYDDDYMPEHEGVQGCCFGWDDPAYVVTESHASGVLRLSGQAGSIYLDLALAFPDGTPEFAVFVVDGEEEP